uniref:Uncharacterized protein n=1 Tax=viral metagenome TaxID=1070528 RepID=A0A6H1ZJK7_9ZZZZ
MRRVTLEIRAETRDALYKAQCALLKAMAADIAEHRRTCRQGVLSRWVRGHNGDKPTWHRTTLWCSECGDVRDYIIDCGDGEGPAGEGELQAEA